MAPTVQSFDEQLPAILAGIEQLVRCESPSGDLAAVARSADVVSHLGASVLGLDPERIVLDGRTHLRWHFGTGPRRLLLLGHHDTVWPLGSLDTHPFSVHDGVLRGPGCLDMKSGLVMAFHAIAALEDTDGITLLITGDEELGSPSSRGLIEAEAVGCRAALVLEAAGANGALKSERKGVSLYQIEVHGCPAHAGLEPENGVNATLEAAHQVLAVAQLADATTGTTVTPTVLTVGTTTNTVPARGTFAVDVRVPDASEQDRVDAAMHALRPVLDGAELKVTGGPNRPPLAANASADLFDRAALLATSLGLGPLTALAVGGASDGNFTAGVGTPTLDGLGAVGAGAHADDEHVVVSELAARTALLSALIGDLLRADRPTTHAVKGSRLGCARDQG
ncbi:M20/M25/M40 family metallo-hydrolase [Streptomyces chartreusis]